MQDPLNKQEIEMLQLRINAAPAEARAEMQAQLDALMQNLAKQEPDRTDEEEAEDAKVEALFDNMPV